MDYQQAVRTYQENPTDAQLYTVAAALCRSLRRKEKLHMLSGQRFFARNGVDLITKGQKYNCRPCLSGGVKRLEHLIEPSYARPCADESEEGEAEPYRLYRLTE